MQGVQRPLSPFWIYRWQITMWLSSLHRITGLLLSAGAIVLGTWLIAAASGPESYARVQQVLAAPWFKLPLVGWAFCFFFHLSNGVRHLAWDTGAGFDRARINTTGWTVVAVTLLATAAFSWFAIL
jgi:succinate dehydrogenase / fumarate reductase, cytochrome b subunit